MFGIKGKIDATIRGNTQHHDCNASSFEVSTDRILCRLLPFELKTGKESAQSMQSARAQLAMYALMMADRYETGLLPHLSLAQTDKQNFGL